VYGAAGAGAAERRRPDIARPARAARRDRHHLAIQFPLILSSRAVAPALATGNAVVLADPRTALTGGFIIARLFEEAGLPKGVLQVLLRRRRSGRGDLH
jgi:benzaldehyde dehydrogenase (NAD)